MKRVLVRHETITKGNGSSKLSLSKKHIVQDIKYYYLNGKVGTVSGDVWKVKPVTNPNYDYITVA